eukprot:COSAG02_NODE_5750_length_4068_cov_1.970522_3_plen_53_part_00
MAHLPLLVQLEYPPVATTPAQQLPLSLPQDTLTASLGLVHRLTLQRQIHALL